MNRKMKETYVGVAGSNEAVREMNMEARQRTLAKEARKAARQTTPFIVRIGRLLARLRHNATTSHVAHD